MDTKPWSNLKARIYSLLSRRPKSNALVVELAELRSGETALDIGCGPGAAVRAAADRVIEGTATGIDRSPGMVEIARKRTTQRNAAFEVGVAEEIPFGDGSFDVVWTVSAFHHWEDPDRGLQECLRVLRSPGRLLILEKHTRGKHGLDRARAGALAEKLRGHGFTAAAARTEGKHMVVTGSKG
jgi:ubiquinone/menaquinone biosynthesis C-methylase UbiE